MWVNADFPIMSISFILQLGSLANLSLLDMVRGVFREVLGYAGINGWFPSSRIMHGLYPDQLLSADASRKSLHWWYVPRQLAPC